MRRHLRRSGEINPRKWSAIAALAVVSSLVAGGRAALLRTAPAAPTEIRAAPGGTDVVEGRDERTRSTELMALAAFEEVVAGGRGLRSLATSAGSLRDWQWDERRGCPPAHPYFGGTGRWPESAPDLVHTALLLQALRAAGVAASDPCIRRASIFITRCQVVDEPGAPADDDRRDRGGFSIGPVVDPADDGGTPRVRLGRPTGASTCLGVTSLLASGAAPDDPRLRGAFRWLEGHYSLEAHPGMARPREGLYGYYYEFARAMTALGRDRIRDSRGVVHDWRAELARKLAEQQHPDGSWTNPDESREPAGRAAPTITGLALLTLRRIRP